MKERVKSVMNYKKPGFWVILLAVLACAVAAVCFLTDPAGTPLTKWTVDEADMNTVLGNVDSMAVVYHGKTVACGEEDMDRFFSVMDEIRVGRTPVSRSRDEARAWEFAIVINDTFHLYFGGAFSEVWVDNGVKPSYSYPIANPDTAVKLLGELGLMGNGAAMTNTAEEWFDYLDSPETMTWGSESTAELAEFPGVVFRYTQTEIAAGEPGRENCRVLISGMPIWNCFFSDVTGDGLPELCATLSFGSGLIDQRVILYDYANGVSYSLADRGNSDYSLRMSGNDGQLWVDQRSYQSRELISTGRLVCDESGIRIAYGGDDFPLTGSSGGADG